MHSAAELIKKNVQDLLTKKINPKLNQFVARLIRRVLFKRFTVACDGVELNSHVCTLKALAETFASKMRYWHIQNASCGVPQCITRPSSARNDVLHCATCATWRSKKVGVGVGEKRVKGWRKRGRGVGGGLGGVGGEERVTAWLSPKRQND